MLINTYKGKNHNIEYTVVNLSELEKSLRIDAEYYDPICLKVEEKITQTKKWSYIEDLLCEIQYDTISFVDDKVLDSNISQLIEDKTKDYSTNFFITIYKGVVINVPKKNN